MTATTCGPTETSPANDPSAIGLPSRSTNPLLSLVRTLEARDERARDELDFGGLPAHDFDDGLGRRERSALAADLVAPGLDVPLVRRGPHVDAVDRNANGLPGLLFDADVAGFRLTLKRHVDDRFAVGTNVGALARRAKSRPS